ncbi:CAP domain-containing protein [Flavobacterium faecale]|uniref:CAP domain-containing protein n=1 Tax=Flavobacterium faecale TaxID=1355330 RepID=UPI003AAC74B4
MNRNFSRVLILSSLFFVFNACTTDAATNESITSTNDLKTQKNVGYTYSSLELETLDIINNYRKSLGLKTLEKINYISIKSEEHNDYMISNNSISHDNFSIRSENIKEVLGAETVNENLAFNFNTAEGVLSAWLKSDVHKKQIIGNFTHFGIAIKAEPVSGKKYFTNIFVRIR